MTTRRTGSSTLDCGRTSDVAVGQGFALRRLPGGERLPLLLSSGPGSQCGAAITPKAGDTGGDDRSRMHRTMNHHDPRQASGLAGSAPSAREAAWVPVRRNPLLPRGWAPLSDEQQRAVLAACDAAPDRLTFRLGSVIHPEVDYRVYQLHHETWGGLWVATRCHTDCDGVVANRELLGLDSGAVRAVHIALEFFNSSDLQVRGQSWRLGVEALAVPPGDPRRV
jgi:hypothetical protein